MFSFVYTFLKGWFDHRYSAQTTFVRIYKQIRKLDLKLHLKEITPKIYAKG